MTELAQKLHSKDTCKDHMLALFYEYPKYGSVLVEKVKEHVRRMKDLEKYSSDVKAVLEEGEAAK
eukprot:8189928-Karenia_brevis.AAC.1